MLPRLVLIKPTEAAQLPGGKSGNKVALFLKQLTFVSCSLFQISEDSLEGDSKHLLLVAFNGGLQ